MEEVSLDDTMSDSASQTQSPKVSTIGTFEDSPQKLDHSGSTEVDPGLQGRSLHDHHHWDLPRFGGEKSVTSSVGVERDESLADDSAVEVGEVTEEQQLDEEAPTEIVLTQVLGQGLTNGLPADSEQNTVDSVSQPISKQGSLLVDAVDSLIDRITHGDMNPTHTAEAIGGLAISHSDVAISSKSTDLEQSPSIKLSQGDGMELAGDGGDGDDAWKGDSELGLEEVSFSDVHRNASQQKEEGDAVEAVAGGTAAEQGDREGEEGQQLRPQMNVVADTATGRDPFTRQGSNSFEAVNQVAAVAAQKLPRKLPGHGLDGEEDSEGSEEEQVTALATTNYQSTLGQQLTASEEDDLTVYRSTDMDAAAQTAKSALRNPTAARAGAAAANPPPSAGAAAAPTATAAAPMERFEIDASQSEHAGTDTSGAPTAANIEREMQEMRDAWERTFKGLLYVDGVDALGRPVVVINADAVPHNMKSSALVYCKTHLEPVVNKGQYVLVFTAKKAKLPSMWIMGAYRTLPRPYRKNVQYIILVRPSRFLKAVLAFMRPFVSKKAGRKIKKVESLGEIGEVTGGEVTLQHLGVRFNEEVASQE